MLPEYIYSGDRDLHSHFLDVGQVLISINIIFKSKFSLYKKWKMTNLHLLDVGQSNYIL